MNTITVAGNVVAKPELRFTPSGVAQATLRVAVNRRFQSAGEWKQEATFLSVVCWSELAEGAADLDKGMKIIVQGRITNREYEGRDGTKKTITEIVAEDIGVSVRKAKKSDRVPSVPSADDEEPF